MKKLHIIFVVFVLPSLWVSGCAAPPGETRPAASVSPQAAQTTNVVAPTFTPAPITATPDLSTDTTATTSPVIPTLPQAKPTPTAMISGELWLRITAPMDNAIVSTKSVWVRGETPAWTVISINEEILLVDESEMFAMEVQLEEGINMIEIVASDIRGNEITLALVVDYEP